MLLTQMKVIADKQARAAKRRASNDDIRIYNRVSSMKGNPFAGDTTVLDHSVDNHTDHGLLTEEDVIDSVLHPRHNFRVRKSTTKLMPDAVSNEVREYWLQKIGQSRINGARSLYKSDKLIEQKDV
jgi:hypothetical protein